MRIRVPESSANVGRRPDPLKREKIIRSAIEIFLEKGYRDASVAEIAGRVGLSASQVYTYYESKEALLRVAAGRMSNELRTRMRELSGKCAKLSERELADLFFDSLADLRPFLLFLMQCMLAPALRQHLGDFKLDHTEALAPWFADWPEEQAVSISRTMSALADSYFLLGDMDIVKNATVSVLENARRAITQE